MAGKGGARPGSGRKKKIDEDRVANLARKAISDTYGSEDKGFQHLLTSGEPSLIKFVFEHGFGKPKDRVEHSGGMDLGVSKVTFE